MDTQGLRSRAQSRNPTSARSRNRPISLPGRSRGSYPSNGWVRLSKNIAGAQPVSDLAGDHEVSPDSPLPASRHPPVIR